MRLAPTDSPTNSVCPLVFLCISAQHSSHFVFTFILVCMCLCDWGCSVHVRMCVGIRGWQWVPSSIVFYFGLFYFALFFKNSFSLNLECIDLTRQASQRAPGIILFTSPQHWGYMHA